MTPARTALFERVRLHPFPQEATVPSGKQLIWTVVIAAAVCLGLEHYKSMKG